MGSEDGPDANKREPHLLKEDPMADESDNPDEKNYKNENDGHRKVAYIGGNADGDGGKKKKGEKGVDPIDDPTRNPNQDKKLTPVKLTNLRKKGDHSHKPPGAGGQVDLYKDTKGNVYEKPKGGGGYGEPIGYNLNKLFSAPPGGGMSPAEKIGTAVSVGIVLYEVLKWGAKAILAL